MKTAKVSFLFKDSDWYGTDWIRCPEIYWLVPNWTLTGLNGFVDPVYDPGFHQIIQKDVL